MAAENFGNRRSREWFGHHDMPGFMHRAALGASGISRASLEDRPVIGICNSWSELISCNVHFRGITEAVRRGVLQAGGLPVEFPTIAVGENLLKPTSMLLRNLMSMDVEESIRGYPMDGVVLLGGCDKTGPAQLMGAASADVPAIMVTGGPANHARFRGRDIGMGTDLWHYLDDLRAGRMSLDEFDQLEAVSMPSAGHCPELGTASSMALVTEALGMSLPGSAAIPATHARRLHSAEEAGRRSVALAREDVRPSHILTREAFDNAITALMSTGGSTNVVLHLLAIAGRLDLDLSLERFDEISQRTPLISSMSPSGEHLFAALDEIGGVPQLQRILAPLLHLDTVGVSGLPLSRIVETVMPPPQGLNGVLSELETPFGPVGSLAVLRGNLAPQGALIKTSAAEPHLLTHTGPALVFDSLEDLHTRIDDPDLPVTKDSVLVLRNVGPVGAPGMPEWGQLPVPKKLLAEGITDMVRISDTRMSGTAYGAVVLHVAPEAAVGGPLSKVRTGDVITLDTAARVLRVEVSDLELDAREPCAAPVRRHTDRGYQRMYLEHVMQADTGCDLDYLVGRGNDPDDTLPSGLMHGWQGGW